MRTTNRLVSTLVCLAGLAFGGAASASAHEAQSEHYTVWTDVSPELADTIAQRMEAMFSAYGQLVGDLSGVDGVRFKVRIYARKADYETYVKATHGAKGDRFRYVHYKLGSPKNEVLGWLVPDPALYARLRHEAFHQYFRRIVGSPPTWLNEGLAELLETSEITPDGKLQVRLNAPMLRRLREGIFKIDKSSLNKKGYKKIELRSLVRMPKPQWLAQQASAYSQSWALVYYMLLEDDRRWATPLVKYLNALDSTADDEANLKAAFDKAFSGVDFGQVYSGYSAWFKRTRAPGAEAYQAASAAFKAKDYAAADQHLAQALSADASNPRYYYLRAEARFSSTKFEGAQEDAEAAIREAPEDELYYLTLGKILVYRKQWPEAKWALDVATQAGLGKHAQRYAAKIPGSTAARPVVLTNATPSASPTPEAPAPRTPTAVGAPEHTGPPEGGSFRVGVLVAAQWSKNSKRYTAKIAAVTPGGFSIHYDDGSKEKGVPEAKLRLLALPGDVSAGDKVLAVWKNVQMWPGVVDSTGPDGCVIRWDDGTGTKTVPFGKICKR